MKIASDISQIVANNSMTGIAAVSSDLGNPLANHQLKSFLSLTAADGVYYNKSVNTLVVTKSGAVFDGIDFRGVAVVVRADDVTIKNSTFDASVGAYSINAVAGTKNLTVDHATFDGQKVDRLGFNVFLNSRGDNTTITNSAFIDAPTDAISIVSGNISGNYLAGAGYATGAHSDGIWIPMTTGAVVISDNVIDWRSTPDAKVATNNAVRITGEGGNVSDVTVKNNVILGGSYSVLVSDGATLTHSKDAVGSVTGVKVVGNVIDHGMYGTLEQTSRPKDMVYSDNMHASGRPVSPGTEAVGALPDLSSLNKITAASANAAINGTSKGDYILGGTGSNYIKGGAGDDVIVGGGGRDFITGGGGKDIFVYTSLKDDGLDRIMDFQQGQDRIDFATIAGAPKALTSWQWLGDESFTGNAWQVRYTQSSGVTTIELDADGDLKADFKLELAGKINLKTSDFILVDRADLAPKLTAANTSLSTKQSVGSSLAVSAPDGVLSHASHAATVSEAGGLSIGSVLKGLYGTLIMAADGSYTYTRAVGAVASGTVDSFGYKIVDAWGQTATAWLNVDLQDPNAAPTMTGAVSAAAIVEGSAGQHLRTGTLSFVDTDAGDTLTTSLSGQSVSVVSGSGADRTAWLSAEQVAALKAGFTMPTGALGANAGEAGWSYALADGALDFLGRDDVARVVTTVQVSDGHGGVANQD
ncbi:M10 family metallopeptidase C-terminal domain-containing protein, partial [Methylorubrum suomiense]|uniref:M10 family metallopeptidase C-terminal domain-containing protein n=2 Tax=Methylorubrum suomiense TaxID=144191 RepID=UPI001EE3204C